MERKHGQVKTLDPNSNECSTMDSRKNENLSAILSKDEKNECNEGSVSQGSLGVEDISVYLKRMNLGDEETVSCNPEPSKVKNSQEKKKWEVCNPELCHKILQKKYPSFPPVQEDPLLVSIPVMPDQFDTKESRSKLSETFKRKYGKKRSKSSEWSANESERSISVVSLENEHSLLNVASFVEVSMNDSAPSETCSSLVSEPLKEKNYPIFTPVPQFQIKEDSRISSASVLNPPTPSAVLVPAPGLDQQPTGITPPEVHDSEQRTVFSLENEHYLFDVGSFMEVCVDDSVESSSNLVSELSREKAFSIPSPVPHFSGNNTVPDPFPLLLPATGLEQQPTIDTPTKVKESAEPLRKKSKKRPNFVPIDIGNIPGSSTTPECIMLELISDESGDSVKEEGPQLRKRRKTEQQETSTLTELKTSKKETASLKSTKCSKAKIAFPKSTKQDYVMNLNLGYRKRKGVVCKLPSGNNKKRQKTDFAPFPADDTPEVGKNIFDIVSKYMISYPWIEGRKSKVHKTELGKNEPSKTMPSSKTDDVQDVGEIDHTCKEKEWGEIIPVHHQRIPSGISFNEELDGLMSHARHTKDKGGKSVVPVSTEAAVNNNNKSILDLFVEFLTNKESHQSVGEETCKTEHHEKSHPILSLIKVWKARNHKISDLTVDFNRPPKLPLKIFQTPNKSKSMCEDESIALPEEELCSSSESSSDEDDYDTSGVSCPLFVDTETSVEDFFELSIEELLDLRDDKFAKTLEWNSNDFSFYSQGYFPLTLNDRIKYLLIPIDYNYAIFEYERFSSFVESNDPAKKNLDVLLLPLLTFIIYHFIKNGHISNGLRCLKYFEEKFPEVEEEYKSVASIFEQLRKFHGRNDRKIEGIKSAFEDVFASVYDNKEKSPQTYDIVQQQQFLKQLRKNIFSPFNTPESMEVLVSFLAHQQIKSSVFLQLLATYFSFPFDKNVSIEDMEEMMESKTSDDHYSSIQKSLGDYIQYKEILLDTKSSFGLLILMPFDTSESKEDAFSKLFDDREQVLYTKKLVAMFSRDEETKLRFQYEQLIVQALSSVKNMEMTPSEICKYIAAHYSSYKLADRSWQNSISKALMSSKFFKRLPSNELGSEDSFKIHCNYKDKLLESVSKESFGIVNESKEDAFSKLFDDSEQVLCAKKLVAMFSRDEETKLRFQYEQLIVQALSSVKNMEMTPSEICKYIAAHYSCYKLADRSWQNSISKALMSSKFFKRLPSNVLGSEDSFKMHCNYKDKLLESANKEPYGTLNISAVDITSDRKHIACSFDDSLIYIFRRMELIKLTSDNPSLADFEAAVYSANDSEANGYELLKLLRGHHHPVYGLRFTVTEIVSNLLLFSAGYDAVKLWSTENFQLIGTFQSSSMYFSIDVSSCSRYFVVTSKEKVAELWDIGHPKSPIKIYKGHDKAVDHCRFHPNNLYVATASSLDKTVRLFHTDDAQPVRLFVGHDFKITAINFSADGEGLLSGDMSGQIFVWNVSNGRRMAILHDHKERVLSLSCDSTGSLLASVGYDRCVRTYDYKKLTGKYQGKKKKSKEERCKSSQLSAIKLTTSPYFVKYCSSDLVVVATRF